MVEEDPNNNSAYGTFKPITEQQDEKQQRYAARSVMMIITMCLVFLSPIALVSIRNPLNTPPTTSTVSTTTRSQSLEQLFLSIPDKPHSRNHLLQYSSKPHSAGTTADYETALYTASKFRQYGLNATIESYDVLLSKPVRRKVAIVSPYYKEFVLDEDVIRHDQCTSDKSALPPFIAYSPSGNVTAKVLYVNYGTQEDFQTLLRIVKSPDFLVGKIALVRYGKNYRGLKAMLAQEYKMAGVLIYSDPADDGYTRGNVYPHGPWRPSSSVQRGSGQFISMYSGDPLTPGYAATPTAPRINISDATNLPKIPVFPLSYGNAQHILKLHRGAIAPTQWQGGLDFLYRIGGNVEVEMDLEIDNYVGPIWNVIGKINGHSNKTVMLGNHRDAWVCGAVDPNSGSSALLEIARGFGTLLSKEGWKPQRTIVLASWDGEEYGLLGSTEFVEQYQEEIASKVVTYFNVDCFKGQQAFAGSSPSIAEFILDTAKAVVDANTNESLYDTWMKQMGSSHLDAVSILGSGTDYTPFFQHVGIISANLGFNESTYGTYHSTMDSVNYMDLYGDPTYGSHITTARWWGLLALRMATMERLPINYSNYGKVILGYVTKFEKSNANFSFNDLRQATNDFISASHNLTTSVSNEKLVDVEKHFILPQGLRHRPWYKHALFGPGYYTGYGATAFPGVADALALNDSAAEVQEQIHLVTDAIKSAIRALLNKIE